MNSLPDSGVTSNSIRCRLKNFEAQWLRLSVRNVLRNARRSLLLILTIAVSALALLLFLGHITASLGGLQESTIRSGLGHLHVAKSEYFSGYAEHPLEYGLNLEEQQQIEVVMQKDERVRRIVPRLLFQGLISSGPRTLTFQGTGIYPSKERQAFGYFQSITDGEALKDGESYRYSVVIGREMARQLGVKPGDSVTLVTSTVSGYMNAMDVSIAGLLTTGLPVTELYMLQMPISSAQELLRTTKISYYTMLLHDTEQTQDMQAALNDALPKQFKNMSWLERDPTYVQLRTMFRNQFVVFGIIIAAVIFLSMSTMTLTTIYERAREIGTLRSFGIPAATVRRIFVYEGAIQGVLGAITGFILAFVLMVLINQAHIMLPPPPGRNTGIVLRLIWVNDFMLPVLVCLPILAMTAAWFTSRRISNMPIVKALHTS